MPSLFDLLSCEIGSQQLKINWATIDLHLFDKKGCKSPRAVLHVMMRRKTSIIWLLISAEKLLKYGKYTSIISCYSERIKRRIEYQLSLNLPMLGPGNRILSSLDHDVTVTCSLTTGGMTQVNTAVFPAITWEWYTFTSYCSLTTAKIIFHRNRIYFSFILEYNMSFVFLHRIKWPNKLWVKKNRTPTCLPFSFSAKADPILIHLSIIFCLFDGLE